MAFFFFLKKKRAKAEVSNYTENVLFFFFQSCVKCMSILQAYPLCSICKYDKIKIATM